MSRPFLRLLWVLLSLVAAGQAEDLRNISAVRALPADKVQEGPRFELTASVTFIARWNGRTEISVQDETAGIYANFGGAELRDLSLGDVLHLRGTVVSGIGPPCLHVEDYRKTGESGLPAATVADFPALDRVYLDSQFVEVTGIVRDAQYDPAVSPPSVILTLQMRGGRADVFLAMKPTTDPARLIDSEVRVRGVPFYYFNQNRQPFGFRLMICEESQIEVLKAVPQPPFEMPVTAVEGLLRYQPVPQTDHRVRVQGVVTLHWPGQFLYLQDGEVGILVKSRRKESLEPGDHVDVAAFAVLNDYSAILEDAEFRKLGHTGEPPATELALEKLTAGEADAKLVVTEGVLESVSERSGRSVLMIRSGTLIVAGELPDKVAVPKSLLTGSKLRLTGVCQVELGLPRKFAVSYRPESARLLLRSADDIHVVSAASWWTLRRLWYALGAAWVVLALGAVLVWSLQGRNARLKAEIDRRERAEAEVKRREEERKILAADLHDSLEQSLTGVALQLQAAGRSGGDDPHLELASRLLKHSREEVHRAVRDLREPSDVDFDLLAALRSLVRHSSAGSAVDFQLDVPEHLPPLGASLAHQVLHLAKEGVTNALKHADAATIRIALGGGGGDIVLEIEDDGIGFPPGNHPGPAAGHFGVQGMKERVARCGGTFGIDSTTGAGTRIRAVLPIPS